jgi:hypothetical protein
LEHRGFASSHLIFLFLQPWHPLRDRFFGSLPEVCTLLGGMLSCWASSVWFHQQSVVYISGLVDPRIVRNSESWSSWQVKNCLQKGLLNSILEIDRRGGLEKIHLGQPSSLSTVR